MPEWRLLTHLMHKDWRHLWYWAVLCWAGVLFRWVLADGALFYSGLLDFSSRNSGPLAATLFVMTWVLPVVALASLFHRDPVLGTTAFWLTRPIPPLAQLAAKLLLYLAAVIIPCVALEVAPLAFIGIRMGVCDYLWVVTGVSLCYAWFLAAALPAALTRSLGGFVLLCSTAVLGGLLLWSQFDAWWPAPPAASFAAQQLWVTRSIVCIGLIVAGGFGILALLYRTRSRRRTVAATAALFILTFVIARAWSANLMGFADPLPKVDLRRVEPGAAAWRAVSLRIENDGRGRATGSGARGVPWTIKVPAAVSGLPRHLSLVELGYRATATTTDGQVLRSEQQTRRWPEPDDPPVAGSHELPGGASVALGCPRQETIEIFRGDGHRPRPLLNVISGTVRFAVVRPFVLARARVRPGQVIDMPRRRVTIERVVEHVTKAGATADHEPPENPGPRLLLSEARVVAPYLSDLGRDGAPWVLVDASGNCHSFVRDRGFVSFPLHFGLDAPTRTPTYDTVGPYAYAPWPRPLGEPLPTDWLGASEIVFVSAEPIGTIELPFEIRNVDGTAVGTTASQPRS